MKRLFTAFVGISSALLIPACQKYLSESNPTGLDTIYTTEETLESSISGVVNGFVNTWYGISGESELFFNYASGISHWRYSNYYSSKPDYVSCLNFTLNSNNINNSNRFQQFYIAISRANNVLDNLASSPVDEDYKLEIEAEAKFYRAIAYFYLVRTWGDCPLRLNISSAADATNCPRTPYYQVYSQIVKDLEFAAAHMRTPARVKAVTPTMPRPCRFAANAYLSTVYLTIGSLLASPDDNFWNPEKEGRKPDFSGIGISKDDYALGARQAYQKALEQAEKILPESASHDPLCEYRLVEKFSDLFAFNSEFSRNGYTAWMNPEQIFVISNTITGNGAANPYVQYVLPDFPAGTSSNETNPQYGRVRPTRWMFQKWCSTYPGQASTVISGAYANSSDPRLGHSLFYSQMDFCNGSGTLKMYPLINGTAINAIYPYYKKTVSERGTNKTSDADLYIMRLAEVYLNAAEAAAFLDDEASARKYIEVLHSRARHSVADSEPDSAMPSWESKTFATKDELLNAIFWESVFELSGEGHDYFNVHRHGARWIIKNICIPKNEFLALPAQSNLKAQWYGANFSYPSDYNAPASEVGGDVFKIRKGLLCSFPQTEVLYNAGISDSDAENDYNHE